jgi:hypothetical protein
MIPGCASWWATGLGEAASRQNEQGRQPAIQWPQAVQAERQLYRCVDQNGGVSIQNAPCPPTSSVTWGQTVPVETPLQASLRQQQSDRQQAEARLRQEEARFAAATGTGNPSQTYYPTGANSESNTTRCQNAKRERDQAYRLAGNNRGFEMIRAWDDIVYEACKGT